MLQGNGMGSFSTRIAFPAGIDAGSVDVEDFNGDGFPDIVASTQVKDTDGVSNVSVILGAALPRSRIFCNSPLHPLHGVPRAGGPWWGSKGQRPFGLYPISSSHSASLNMVTPSSAAFFALEPASAPTTT